MNNPQEAQSFENSIAYNNALSKWKTYMEAWCCQSYKDFGQLTVKG